MHKLILATAIALAAPTLALAQADSKPAAKPAAVAKPATAKPAAKPAAKTEAKSDSKPATTAKAAPHHKPAPKLARTAAKAVEAVTPVDDDTSVVLSADELAIAERVEVGASKCELGANVVVTADEKRPGFFNVQLQGQKVRYHMHPVESRTGAIRLEDPRAGALWLQLGNKSMLMNQKIGERLADDCQTPKQVAVAEDLKSHPAPALFDASDIPQPQAPQPKAAVKKK